MKRKFKLFATVASLCLSVALMAFGVYAATSVTYNVSGTVSFSAHVACTWTVKATYNDTSKTPVGTPDTKQFLATDTINTDTADIGNIEFGTEEGHDTIIYTITCENEGAQAITIGLASDPTLFGNALLEVTLNDGDVLDAGDFTQASYSEELAATQTWTLTITVHLTSLTQGLSGNTSLSLALTATAA